MKTNGWNGNRFWTTEECDAVEALAIQMPYELAVDFMMTTTGFNFRQCNTWAVALCIFNPDSPMAVSTRRAS